MSENYVVLALCPLTIPFDRLVNGKGFLPQLEWAPQEGSSIVVWDLRKGSDGLVGSWKAEPFWVSVRRGRAYVVLPQRSGVGSGAGWGGVGPWSAVRTTYGPWSTVRRF